MIIDSHCHLDYPVLFDKLDDVVKNAISNDVKYLLSICTTLDSYKKIQIIVNKYIMFFLVGHIFDFALYGSWYVFSMKHVHLHATLCALM